MYFRELSRHESPPWPLIPVQSLGVKLVHTSHHAYAARGVDFLMDRSSSTPPSEHATNPIISADRSLYLAKVTGRNEVANAGERAVKKPAIRADALARGAELLPGSGLQEGKL